MRDVSNVGDLEGPKKVENRSRFPDFSGPILLNTGKVTTTIGSTFADGTPVPRAENLPLGAIVGSVFVVMSCLVEAVDVYEAGGLKIRKKKDQSIVVYGDERQVLNIPDFEERLKALVGDPFVDGPVSVLSAAFGSPISSDF